jgi:hypothetical protein
LSTFVRLKVIDSVEINWMLEFKSTNLNAQSDRLPFLCMKRGGQG